MKARVLVLAVNDGDEFVEIGASRIVTPQCTPWSSAVWDQLALEDARLELDFDAHGFIDVEIPDDVIAQVLRRHADAGVVAAEPVSEVRS